MRIVLLLQIIYVFVARASHLARFHQEGHDNWLSNCGYSDVANDKTLGWFVVVHNPVSQTYNGAAVITPRHVVAARSSVSNGDGTPTPIDSLELLVFNSTNMTGIDFTKLKGPHFLELTQKYEIGHVIIPTVSEKENIYSLAIIEIFGAFPHKLNPVCLNMIPSQTLPAKARVDVFYLSSTIESAYQKRPIEFGVYQQFCHELHCEERMKSGKTTGTTARYAFGEPGDVWFRTLEGRDNLLGIALGDGTAVSIAFWSDFLCKMIGACTNGFETQTPQKHSDFPYFLDGVFHPHNDEEECSEEYHQQLVRRSTPFTRLTRIEQRSLARECRKTFGSSNAPATPEMAHSFLVTLVSEKEECHFGGYVSDCDRNLLRCSGVLISPLHVISSASCIKQALEETGSTLDAIFTDNSGFDNEKFPFQEENIFSLHYDRIKVGKRWIRVAKVVAPYVSRDERRDEYDIALVQLERRIPIESYIKPICIKQEVLWSPQFRVVQQLEIPIIVERSIYVHSISESQSKCPQEKKDDCYLINFYTNVSINIEHRGSPLIGYSDESGSQQYLIGIVFNQTGTLPSLLTNAHRIEYFSTFICIHTGVCRDDEDFNRRLFAASFVENDLTLHNGLIEKGMARSNEASGLNWRVHEKEQNKEVQAECGKKPPSNRMFNGNSFKIDDWPWPVFLGYEDSSYRDGIVPISRPTIVLYGGVSWNSAPDIEGNSMRFVCLPKDQDFVDDDFEKIATFFGGGKGEFKRTAGERLLSLAYNLTDPDVVIVPDYFELQFQMAYRTREAHGYAARGDSGGPLLRRRPSDDRYVLYGVLHGGNESCYECYNGWEIYTTMRYFVHDVCRITGICADAMNEEELSELEIDGSRLCN